MLPIGQDAPHLCWYTPVSHGDGGVVWRNGSSLCKQARFAAKALSSPAGEEALDVLPPHFGDVVALPPGVPVGTGRIGGWAPNKRRQVPRSRAASTPTRGRGEGVEWVWVWVWGVEVRWRCGRSPRRWVATRGQPGSGASVAQPQHGPHVDTQSYLKSTSAAPTWQCDARAPPDTTYETTSLTSRRRRTVDSGFITR